MVQLDVQHLLSEVEGICHLDHMQALPVLRVENSANISEEVTD